MQDSAANCTWQPRVTIRRGWQKSRFCFFSRYWVSIPKHQDTWIVLDTKAWIWLLFFFEYVLIYFTWSLSIPSLLCFQDFIPPALYSPSTTPLFLLTKVQAFHGLQQVPGRPGACLKWCHSYRFIRVFFTLVFHTMSVSLLHCRILPSPLCVA